MLLPRGRTAIVALALTALLGIPRAASADLIDWIWDLSGPPMIGVVTIHCEFTETAPKCYSPFRLTPVSPWAITLEPPLYVSTGQGHGDNKYKRGAVWLLSLDPMLEKRSSNATKVVIFHAGAGASFSFFRGDDFKGFHKNAVKLKAGFSFPKVPKVDLEVGFTARYYPSGFNGDEFGGKRTAGSKPEHWVKGMNFILSFKERPPG